MRTFSQTQKTELFIASGGSCQECGVPLGADFHADHVHPFAKGGETSLDNGQALCPSCNLAKSDKEIPRKDAPYLRTIPKQGRIIPLDWQDRFASVVESTLANGGKIITSNITVGAGKTFGTLNAWLTCIAPTQAKPLMVVLVPALNLAEGWIDTAADKAGVNFARKVGLSTFDDIRDGDTHGLVITYATAKNRLALLELLCIEFDVTLVIDECQYASESNTWGNAVATMTPAAGMTLALTGTPFRSVAGETLVGFEYEGPLAVVDFTYDYHEARRDGICPELQWTAIGGRVSWVEEVDGKEEPSSSAFGENEERDQAGKYLNLPLINKRLKVAVTARRELLSPFVPSLLKDADSELSRIRGSHRDAGGIVFALDQRSAWVIAEILRSFGRAVAIVMSESLDSAQQLEDFKRSGAEWIVSVGMLKEGTDIPRLRVAAFLNNVTTPRNIIQFVGRLLRLDRSYPDPQPVMAFILNDPRLVAILSEFGACQEFRKKSDRTGNGGGGGSTRELVSIDGSSIAVAGFGITGEVGLSGNDIARVQKAFHAAGVNRRAEHESISVYHAVRELETRIAVGKEIEGAPYQLAREIARRMGVELAQRSGLRRDEGLRLSDLFCRTYSRDFRENRGSAGMGVF